MNRFRTWVPIALGLLVWSLASRGVCEDSTFTGWKKSLVIDFTTTQTAYSDSWVGGEAGSVNWVSNLNGAAERQLSEKFNLRSTLKMSFGQTLTQNAETKEWAKPAKSTDLIDWENLGRFTLHGFVDPYVALRLETQFYDGRNPARKLYFSPLKLTESAGIAKKLYTRADDFVTSRLGLALREIRTKAITDPVTLTTESATVTDGGVEFVTDATLTLGKSLLYTGKLGLFKALSYSEKDQVAGTPQADDWKAVDASLENIITAKVARVVAVIFYTQLLYDKQIEKRVRIKETLAIGFTLTMI
jgi:hypothetical protein